jgi:hypothetical protein
MFAIGDLTQVIDYFISTNQFKSLLFLSIRATLSSNSLNSPLYSCTKIKSIPNWYKINEKLFFESDNDDNYNSDDNCDNDNNNGYNDKNFSPPMKYSSTSSKSSFTSHIKQVNNHHHHHQVLNLSEIRIMEALSVYVRTLRYFIKCELSCKYSNTTNSNDKDDDINKDNNIGVNSGSNSIHDDSNSFDVSYLYELLHNRPTILDINYLVDIVQSCVPIVTQSLDATIEEELDINDKRVSMILNYIKAL